MSISGLQSCPPPMTQAKQRILEAAYDLMLESMEPPSLSEIAQAAGISRQALYVHFGARGALFMAIGAYMDQRFNVSNERRRIVEASNGIDALHMMADFQARIYPKIFGALRAFRAPRRVKDEDAEQLVQSEMRNNLNDCANTIERLRREKLLKRTLDQPTAADLLWALTSISLWEDLVLMRGWSDERYKQHVAELLISSLIE